MATVYAARDLRHDRLMRPEVCPETSTGRFLREIRIAAQLTHPHILPLIDSGESCGVMFYVMPLIEGETLRTRVAKAGELPVAESLRILRYLLDALAYAHSQGVVHRDLKPENILLGDSHAYVTDFGIAKALVEAPPLSRRQPIAVWLRDRWPPPDFIIPCGSHGDCARMASGCDRTLPGVDRRAGGALVWRRHLVSNATRAM